MGQRFYLKAKAGLNLSQIDGDHTSGFDYLGLQGGLVGVARLGGRVELLAEFLYNQKGSRFKQEVTRINQLGSFRIQLDYIEVPVLFNYVLAYAHNDLRSWEFFCGASFGALVRKNISETQDPGKPLLFIPITSDISTTSFNGKLGLQTYFNENFGLFASFTFSLKRIYDNPSAPEPTTQEPVVIEHLRPYFISLGASMNIF